MVWRCGSGSAIKPLQVLLGEREGVRNRSFDGRHGLRLHVPIPSHEHTRGDQDRSEFSLGETLPELTAFVQPCVCKREDAFHKSQNTSESI